MAEVPYVRKLTTNIKSPDGSSYTRDLGARVLLVGPNESGKSAIAQALQLVTTGSVSGLLFRRAPVKLPAQISTLGKDGVHIRAEFSNGDICTWDAEPGKKAQWSGPAAPGIGVEDIRTAFSGSADSCRRFLIEKLIGSVVQVKDVLDNVPPNLHDLVKPMLGDMVNTPTITGAEYIAMLDNVSDNKSKANARVKAMESVISTMGSRATPVEENQIEWVWSEFTVAYMADWFKAQGKRATADKEQGDTTGLTSLRWLAGALGGKEGLSKAKPLSEAREGVEKMLDQSAIARFCDFTRATQKKVQEQADDWAKVEKGMSEIMDDVGTVALDTFEERVNRFMGDDKFRVNRETLWPEIYRTGPKGGRWDAALSGSTEARVLAAMACGMNPPGRATVLVVDDRSFDGAHLARLLRDLEKAPCQVIVMSTIEPRGRKRASWTVIKLGEVDDQADTDTDKKGTSETVTPSNAADADGVVTLDEAITVEMADLFEIEP